MFAGYPSMSFEFTLNTRVMFKIINLIDKFAACCACHVLVELKFKLSNFGHKLFMNCTIAERVIYLTQGTFHFLCDYFHY